MAVRASRSRRLMVGGWAPLAAVLLCGLLAGAGSSSASLSRPVAAAGPSGAITSVVFSGAPAKPIVTLFGKGLSIPPPKPPVSPSNQPLCPKVIHGNAGFDYGTRFYVIAFANGKLKLAAGRYRPSANELDCIGLIVLSQSATKVRFRFGAAYREFAYPPLVNRDSAKVVLNGFAFKLVVRYT